MAGVNNISDMLHQLETFIGAFNRHGLTKGKQSILKSFLRTATREGITNVSMRSLGAEACVKPPTIYSHFPEGRDQVVAAAMRWHYSGYAQALLVEFSTCVNPQDFWKTLVRFHVAQQLREPANDSWDILIATDRISKQLPEEVRDEIETWERFCDYMYAAIAQDMGHVAVDINARIARKTLDAVCAWWNWDGSDEHLDAAVAYGSKAAEAIMKIAR